MDKVILQSDGRVALKVPDKFGQRIFWFSSISDSTVEPELSDPYADPQTGEIHEQVSSFRREPVTISAPYDEDALYPIYRLLENTERSELQRLKFELTEKIGTKTVLYEGASYRSHTRSGTDLTANTARTFSIELFYTRQVL